jgi:hypothetical protein
MWSHTVLKPMQRNLIIILQSVLHGPKVYDKTIQRNLINILKRLLLGTGPEVDRHRTEFMPRRGRS